MDLDARKLSFIQEFLSVQNEELISKLEKLLRKSDVSESESVFEPMTKEKLNVETDLALKDSTQGRMENARELLNHEDL
jgi:hypothetical protein